MPDELLTLAGLALVILAGLACVAVTTALVAQSAEGDDDQTSGLLPALSEGQALDVKGITPEQKFTQPPPRCYPPPLTNSQP